MAVVQVPPAPGSSGQQIDVFQLSAASTTFREIVAIGSAFTSSGLAVVTTSGGLQVNISSGTVTLSSNHTVTATAATNPWSSAPSFNLPIVSASSGLVQISGTPTINIVGTSGAVAPATSSGGLGVTILSGAGAGSTAVTLIGSTGDAITGTVLDGLLVQISNVDSLALTSGIVGISSGIVTLSSDIAISSGRISITSGSISLSSAMAISSGLVSLTSGTVTLSSTPFVNLVGTSSAVAPVTSSGGLGVTIIAGAGAGSTTVHVVPGSTASLLIFSYVSSSSVNSNNVQSGNTALWGYAIFNTTGAQRHVHLYNTSSAPTVGSTANFLMTLGIPGSTQGGGGANMMFPVQTYSTRGLGFTITDSPLTTSTGVIGGQDLVMNLFYV